MVRVIGLGLALFAAYLALSGNFSPSGLALAGAAAALGLLLALRLDVLGSEGAGPLRAPWIVWFAMRLLPRMIMGAVKVATGALGRVDRLSPGFVRVRRIAAASGFGSALGVAACSAEPGAAVADADEETLLVHVWSEPDVDPLAFQALDAAAARACDGAGP